MLSPGDMLRDVIFPFCILDDPVSQEPNLANGIWITRSFDRNDTDTNINRSDDVRQSQCASRFGTVDQHLEELIPIK